MNVSVSPAPAELHVEPELERRLRVMVADRIADAGYLPCGKCRFFLPERVAFVGGFDGVWTVEALKAAGYERHGEAWKQKGGNAAQEMPGFPRLVKRQAIEGTCRFSAPSCDGWPTVQTFSGGCADGEPLTVAPHGA